MFEVHVYVKLEGQDEPELDTIFEEANKETMLMLVSDLIVSGAGVIDRPVIEIRILTV